MQSRPGPLAETGEALVIDVDNDDRGGLRHCRSCLKDLIETPEPEDLHRCDVKDPEQDKQENQGAGDQAALTKQIAQPSVFRAVEPGKIASLLRLRDADNAAFTAFHSCPMRER